MKVVIHCSVIDEGEGYVCIRVSILRRSAGSSLNVPQAISAKLPDNVIILYYTASEYNINFVATVHLDAPHT